MTTAVQLAQSVAPGVSLGFKNRIINGAMVISQRGTSFTSSGGNQYTLDRWFEYGSVASKFTVAQSSTAPAGYINSLLVTSSAATSVGSSDQYRIEQDIEGLNVADLGWGAVGASTVTLSFWVRSSLTGTFGGSLRNGAADRSYPFSYTISSANTWEQKSITVSGDTTGTWLTTNGIGLRVCFGLGVGSTLSGTAGSWAAANYASATGATSVVGTSGATFYITGVQLEVGTAATNFEFRDYGRELIMCQRYFEMVNISYNQMHAIYYDGSQVNSSQLPFQVTKRASPTCTPTTQTKQFCNYGGGAAVSATTVTINSNAYAYGYQYNGTSLGNGPIMNMAATTVAASAEL